MHHLGIAVMKCPRVKQHDCKHLDEHNLVHFGGASAGTMGLELEVKDRITAVDEVLGLVLEIFHEYLVCGFGVVLVTVFGSTNLKCEWGIVILLYSGY
jgi:hypothetical protein